MRQLNLDGCWQICLYLRHRMQAARAKVLVVINSFIRTQHAHARWLKFYGTIRYGAVWKHRIPVKNGTTSVNSECWLYLAEMPFPNVRFLLLVNFEYGHCCNNPAKHFCKRIHSSLNIHPYCDYETSYFDYVQIMHIHIVECCIYTSECHSGALPYTKCIMMYYTHVLFVYVHVDINGVCISMHCGGQRLRHRLCPASFMSCFTHTYIRTTCFTSHLQHNSLARLSSNHADSWEWVTGSTSIHISFVDVFECFVLGLVCRINVTKCTRGAKIHII